MSGPRVSGLTLSIVVGGIAFAVVAAVVVMIAVARPESVLTGAAFPAVIVPPAFEDTSTPITTTAAPFTTTTAPARTSSAVPPTDSDTIPAGYRRVSGPGGIVVNIPQGWVIRPGAVPSNQQADNPSSPGDFVRFGGSPSPAQSLLDSIAENEVSNPNVRIDYQRIRLAQVPSVTGVETVDWEFTYVKDGQSRHAFGRYWRTAGMDYVVYASTDVTTWADMRPVLDVLIQTSGPQ